MCLYPADNTEPEDKFCAMKSGNNNLLFPISQLKPQTSKTYKLRIHPFGDMVPDGNYTFSIIQTTQLSETILSSGIWTTDSGVFLNKVYTAYFPSTAKLLSFFYECKVGQVSGSYSFFPLEDFFSNKIQKTGDLIGKRMSVFLTEDDIALKCNSKKSNVVSFDDQVCIENPSELKDRH